MKYRWNPSKNALLKGVPSRGHIDFETCVSVIRNGGLLDIIANPNYGNQRIFIIDIDGYAYVVPFLQQGDECFLKTAYPSRKYTNRYLRKKPDDK